MVIVNDARHLHNLVPASDKIKGIGGKCVRIAGIRNLILPLKSDNGTLDVVSNLHTLCVPSSPYNIIPPQVLIQQMRRQHYKIDHFLHDDREYIYEHIKSPAHNTSKTNM